MLGLVGALKVICNLIKEGSVFGRAPPFDLYPFDLINSAWKCIRFDV